MLKPCQNHNHMEHVPLRSARSMRLTGMSSWYEHRRGTKPQGMSARRGMYKIAIPQNTSRSQSLAGSSTKRLSLPNHLTKSGPAECSASRVKVGWARSLRLNCGTPNSVWRSRSSVAGTLFHRMRSSSFAAKSRTWVAPSIPASRSFTRHAAEPDISSDIKLAECYPRTIDA